MNNPRSKLFIDCLEFTLPIPVPEAMVIYNRIQHHWDTYSSHPRHTVATKHRYVHAYTFILDDELEVEIFTVPIGKGQSSVKIKFNPAHLTESNIKKLLKFLKRILGSHAYRIYYEATVTRYDITYDIHDLKLCDLDYLVKHLRDFDVRYMSDDKQLSVTPDQDEPTSYTYGTYGGPCYARFYNKPLEQFTKTGDRKFLEKVSTRFEFQIRRDIPFYKLWNIPNDFNRVMAVNFDTSNKSLVRNFVQSHKKNRDIRKGLTKQLDCHYLHPIVRFSYKDHVKMICTAFNPYREHLFPNNKTWIKERTNALSLLERLIPRKEIVDKHSLVCRPRKKIDNSSSQAADLVGPSSN